MVYKTSDKTLIVIDGSSFLYRAYYGLRPLHTPQGVPVQAVYGFCRMIKKLTETFHPTSMILVWDSKGKTERHTIFSDYKATRQAPPSDLFDQKILIQEFADTIQLCQWAQVGIEADDLLLSVAREWKRNGGNVVIVTSDKDMGQAIEKDIVLYDYFKETIIDNVAFEKKMGFSPNKTVFYFSLVGDSSDNIPGAKGIGEKSALELVSHFSSIADLYKHIDRVESKRIKTALIASERDVLLSEKLFTLLEYPVPLTAKDMSFDIQKWSQARPFFEKLQFKSMLKDIADKQLTNEYVVHVSHSKTKGYEYICVTTQEQLDQVVSTIKKEKIFAYDIEGIGLGGMSCAMVGFSICCRTKESFYIPFGHTTGQTQLSQDHVLKTLKPFFEDESYKKILHHAKFDNEVMHRYGVAVNGVIFDTLIAANLVKEEWEKISLKVLSMRYLNEPMLTFDQVVTHKGYENFSQVPLEEATEYAAADAHQTLRLYPILKKMVSEKNLDELYYSLELPLISVLERMEEQGILCDVEVLKVLDKTVSSQLHEIKETIISVVGPKFADINLNSPKQIEELLFKHLQLPTQRKSAKGSGFSTDNAVLVELAKTHPIPGYIAHYRELFKLKSTYIDALPMYINPVSGKIHTQFSQTQVATGRLSSLEPNLQNVPAEGIGLGVRKAFIPGEGKLFLSVDYSQIELRILAHLSQDEKLKEAFLHGADIHAQTAAGLFGIPIDKVDKHQRSIGKRINFSILYGLTPYGLSKDLDISLKDAKKYIEAYFQHYPKVSTWMDSVVEFAKKHGYVVTMLGRRRVTPGIKERNKHLFDLARRVAINTVAQGTAAEIMKKGMLVVDALLQHKKYEAAIILQIHDELLITVSEEHSEEVQKIVQKVLESVVDWEIPLTVSCSLGKNWQEVS